MFGHHQLLDRLNTNDSFLKIHCVKSGDFKHFKDFEDQFFKKYIASGKFLSGHIISVDSSNPIMTVLEDKLGASPPHRQNMKSSV